MASGKSLAKRSAAPTLPNCNARAAMRKLFRCGCGFLAFIFETVRDPDFRPFQILLPGGGIDKRIGLAGLALLELRRALENGAVRIIGAGIPAMVGEEHLDARYSLHLLHAAHCVLEALDAVAS